MKLHQSAESLKFPDNPLIFRVKYSSPAQVLALLGLSMALCLSSAHGVSPADWRVFNATATQNWSAAGSWTGGTGIPTPGNSLVINFDPTKAGTTGGTISVSPINSNNDLGTVQLNTLNLSGSSSSASSSRTVNISGGSLLFGGSVPSINVATAGATSFINYVVSSNILLNADLNLSLGGTGQTTLVAGAGTALSSNTSGLKTLTVTGGGTASLGNTSTSAIADGSGQVGVTMNGTGTLTIGGTNTFTGDLVINSGTVATSISSAGNGNNLGAGNAVKLGATGGGAANATLQLGNHTYGNNFIVQSGNAGTATIQNTGSAQSALTNVLTANKDVSIVSIGTGTFALNGGLAGGGNVTFTNNGTGNFSIGGSNTGFTGNVSIATGIVRVANAAALGVANRVSANTGSTFNLNGNHLTIAGLDNGTGGGGTVTNTGAARSLTLGGGGAYLFGGNLTATIPANLALTIALTGTGKQTLTGNSDYDGVTAVNSGTLLINGDNSASNGAVTVSSGATLGGTGTIGGATSVSNGGTISAGDDLGTLTFNSHLTIDGGAGIAGAAALFHGGDLVDVNGTLTLNDGWNLTLSTGFQSGGSFTLFTYSTPGLVLDLTPDIDISSLGFAPGTLTLTDTGSSIVLNGISMVPEPNTWMSVLLGFGALVIFRRRRLS